MRLDTKLFNLIQPETLIMRLDTKLFNLIQPEVLTMLLGQPLFGITKPEITISQLEIAPDTTLLAVEMCLLEIKPDTTKPVIINYTLPMDLILLIP